MRTLHIVVYTLVLFILAGWVASYVVANWA
jgi:hypothetical protein